MLELAVLLVSSLYLTLSKKASKHIFQNVQPFLRVGDVFPGGVRASWAYCKCARASRFLREVTRAAQSLNASVRAGEDEAQKSGNKDDRLWMNLFLDDRAPPYCLGDIGRDRPANWCLCMTRIFTGECLTADPFCLKLFKGE